MSPLVIIPTLSASGMMTPVSSVIIPVTLYRQDKKRDGARHSNHANSTDCDDVTGLCVSLCAHACAGVPSILLSCHFVGGEVVDEAVDGAEHRRSGAGGKVERPAAVAMDASGGLEEPAARGMWSSVCV